MFTNRKLSCVAAEVPRPLPRVCPCQNGGVCAEAADGALECVCRAPLQPPLCARAAATARAAPAAVLVPVLLVLLLAVAGAAAWFVIRKRPL